MTLREFSNHAVLPKGALPFRTRLRLRLTRVVDDAAYWLVCRDHCGAAMWLYKICGMW